MGATRVPNITISATAAVITATLADQSPTTPVNPVRLDVAVWHAHAATIPAHGPGDCPDAPSFIATTSQDEVGLSASLLRCLKQSLLRDVDVGVGQFGADKAATLAHGSSTRGTTAGERVEDGATLRADAVQDDRTTGLCSGHFSHLYDREW